MKVNVVDVDRNYLRLSMPVREFLDKFGDWLSEEQRRFVRSRG